VLINQIVYKANCHSSSDWQFKQSAVVGNNSIRSKMLGFRRMFLNTLTHASLADIGASPRCSRPENSAQSTSGECGLASPIAGPEPERQTTAIETIGPCPLGLALVRLEPLENGPSALPARYRHPMASAGVSSLLEMEEPPW